MERRKEGGRTRQIALGLCDRRLSGQRFDVIRRNIQDLIEPSQRFGKMTTTHVGKRMLTE